MFTNSKRFIMTSSNCLSWEIDLVNSSSFNNPRALITTMIGILFILVIEKKKNGLFFLTFKRVKRIPSIVVIKALGLLKDEELTKSISQERQFDEVIINLLEFVSIK